MKLNYTLGKAGIVTVLLAALTGCTTYVVQRPEPQPAAYVPPSEPAPVVVEQAPPPPPAVVVIQSDDDFVQPLTPYGEWVVAGDYGRCWRPAGVEASWRPYANGHWELTGDGWYWVSDEPWAWATYHYGRWQLAGGYGWVWVPQTQWAPAWVSWREGGGYVGWAPLPPEPRGGVTINVAIAPAAFCFVEERRMHDPVRPTTVIVNNTTIINKTVNITKTKVVNKVVVNEGPRADEVERATGKKIQQASIADLRHQEEEPVAEKHQNLRARTDRGQQPEQKQSEPKKETLPQNLQNRQNEKPAPTKPARVEPAPAPMPPRVGPRPAPVPAPPSQEARPVEKPVAKPADRTPPALKNNERQQQQQQKLLQQQQKQRQLEVQPAPKSQQERLLQSGKQPNQNAPQNGRATERNTRGRQPAGTNATENAGQAPK